ncbi:zonadhesin-like [Haliotis rufescens]|uniref:zonadhesin-like n=1 Tax=Haliotis rufescens TaxID=6454 RepID=UPI00201F77F8|nr:zonadhesin-like [Haliotis rufescens]
MWNVLPTTVSPTRPSTPCTDGVERSTNNSLSDSTIYALSRRCGTSYQQQSLRLDHLHPVPTVWNVLPTTVSPTRPSTPYPDGVERPTNSLSDSTIYTLSRKCGTSYQQQSLRLDHLHPVPTVWNVLPTTVSPTRTSTPCTDGVERPTNNSLSDSTIYTLSRRCGTFYQQQSLRLDHLRPTPTVWNVLPTRVSLTPPSTPYTDGVERPINNSLSDSTIYTLYRRCGTSYQQQSLRLDHLHPVPTVWNVLSTTVSPTRPSTPCTDGVERPTNNSLSDLTIFTLHRRCGTSYQQQSLRLDHLHPTPTVWNVLPTTVSLTRPSTPCTDGVERPTNNCLSDSTIYALYRRCGTSYQQLSLRLDHLRPVPTVWNVLPTTVSLTRPSTPTPTVWNVLPTTVSLTRPSTPCTDSVERPTNNCLSDSTIYALYRRVERPTNNSLSDSTIYTYPDSVERPTNNSLSDSTIYTYPDGVERPTNNSLADSTIYTLYRRCGTSYQQLSLRLDHLRPVPTVWNVLPTTVSLTRPSSPYTDGVERPTNNSLSDTAIYTLPRRCGTSYQQQSLRLDHLHPVPTVWNVLPTTVSPTRPSTPCTDGVERPTNNSLSYSTIYTLPRRCGTSYQQQSFRLDHLHPVPTVWNVLPTTVSLTRPSTPYTDGVERPTNNSLSDSTIYTLPRRCGTSYQQQSLTRPSTPYTDGVERPTNNSLSDSTIYTLSRRCGTSYQQSLRLDHLHPVPTRSKEKKNETAAADDSRWEKTEENVKN